MSEQRERGSTVGGTDATKLGALVKRLALVMADVRSLPKDGHNKHDNYHYTTAATAVEAIGGAMAKHGLAMIPMLIHQETGRPENEKAYYSTVDVEYHIMDTDGNVYAARWSGQGVNFRTPDKALKTALTNAQTTFLLKLFNVGADDDDPERDSDTGEGGGQFQQRNQTGGGRQPQPPARPNGQQPTKSNGQPPADVQQLADSVGATVTVKGNGQTPAAQLEALGAELYGEQWPSTRDHNIATKFGQGKGVGDLTADEITKFVNGLKKLKADRAAQPA